MNNYELVKFVDNEFSLDVSIDYQKETVWLTQRQMAYLFDVSTDNISLHIKNILKEDELDSSTAEESSVVQTEGKRKVKRAIKLYNLDMIISVGYRVKSKRGIQFRRWANQVLKDYLIKGLAINEKKMAALNKTIEIQSRMLSDALELDETELSSVIKNILRPLIYWMIMIIRERKLRIPGKRSEH